MKKIAKYKDLFIKIIACVYMLAITVVIVPIAIDTLLKDIWQYERTSYSLQIIMLMIILICALIYDSRSFKYTKMKAKYWYLVCIVFTVLLFTTLMISELSYNLFPLFAFGICYTCFFGITSGICASIAYCYVYALFAGLLLEEALMLIIISIFGCLILKLSKRVITLPLQIVLFLLANIIVREIYIYYTNEKFIFDDIISMMINPLITIVIAIVLVMVSNRYIFKRTYLFRLKTICKEDYDLLLELKSKSIPIYYHSSEVAELAFTLARAIGANKYMCKAGALYHEAGAWINGTKEQKLENTIKVCKKAFIPEPVIDIIKEHDTKYDTPHTIESAVVMLSDTLVSTMNYIKTANNNAKISNSKVVEAVLNERFNSLLLDSSGLTIKQFNDLRKACHMNYPDDDLN